MSGANSHRPKAGVAQGSGGILRNSSRQTTFQGANRRKKRASFSEDMLIESSALRGIVDSSMNSANTSQGSERDETQGPRKKRPSWHEPLWRIARPRLQTAKSEGLVSMGNVENGSAQNVTAESQTQANAMEMRPAFCKPSKASMDCMNFILESCIWNVLVLVFTLVLLFGSSIQWFVEDYEDASFDVIFCVTMLFLFADIILTSFVDAAYFPLYWKSWRDFECGSFLFWFDVVGVGSLLYNLSFVWGVNSKARNVIIDVSGGTLQEFNYKQLVHLDWVLFWTVVVRTMRTARFLNITPVLNFANNFSARSRSILSTLLTKIKHVRSLRCFSRNNQNRTMKAPGVMSSSQINVRDETMFKMHVDNEAAAKIQKTWLSYRDSESYYDSSSQRSHLRKQTERIARLKRNDQNKASHRRMHMMANSRTSTFKTKKKNTRYSEIGLAMNYITTKRVAIGVFLAILFPLLFTNQEKNMTAPLAMVSFHNSLVLWRNQVACPELSSESPSPSASETTSVSPSSVPTASPSQSPSSTDEFKRAANFFAQNAHDISGNLLYLSQTDSSVPEELLYEINFTEAFGVAFDGNSQIMNYTLSQCIVDGTNGTKQITTIGVFDIRADNLMMGSATLLFTIFLLIIWFLGLVVFAGPVTTLVVIPIERMIRLLSMLVKDPLGYENSPAFKTFAFEEDDLATHTCFTQDNLKGMETAFLMNSILRIGSLMKVGFGAAGVQIIRDSLTDSNKKKKKASTVSCIFLFCDIRQFTDTSECLQEEIFLFTNKIAQVVHSICHSFGGFANQNKGDAFLVIWKLEDSGPNKLSALNKEADSALFSVVQICMALNYDDYFLEDISEEGNMKMKNKFSGRKGNMVQIGFGLHAGKAVEGAIGSSRKLDATYLSNEVELAEFLESSTKKYGVNVLMSGAFFKLLHPSNRRRCRQVDEAFFAEEFDEEFDPDLFIIPEEEDTTWMQIYTYDFELEVLRKLRDSQSEDAQSEAQSSSNLSDKSSFRRSISTDPRFSNGNSRRSFFGGAPNNPATVNRRKKFTRVARRISIFGPQQEAIPENFVADFFNDESTKGRDKLILPSGPQRYHSSVWKSDSMTKIRQKFTLKFFHNFELGLNAYLEGDWKEAKRQFEFMAQRYDDTPSKVLLEKMSRSNFIPPYKFRFLLGRV